MTGPRGSSGELPGWCVRVLSACLPPDERAATLAEVAEAYEVRCANDGEVEARRWLRRQVRGFVVRAPRVRRRVGNERRGTMEGRSGLIEPIRGDVRWALRTLRRRPGFAAVAVATLALGMGANAAIFTLVNAQFFADLPYDRHDELVLLWETDRNSDEVTTVAPGNYFAWKDEASSFASMAAYNVDFATLSGDASAERVVASVVTPEFFDVLGVPADLGGTFVEESVRIDDANQVVLSHGLWTRRYGADPTLVGSSVRIDGRPHTVVGVMPPDFRQPEASMGFQRTELWRPMLLDGRRDDHGSRYLRAVARLDGGVTPEQARAEMRALGARLAEAHPETNAGRSVLTFTLDEYLFGSARPTLMLLLAAGVGVLLIVCANVANLTLARGEERRAEFALRAALGSGTRRLVRQLAVESVVLALLGAAVGTVVLFVGRDLLQAVQASFFSGLVDAAVDARVLTVTALGAVVVGLAFSMPLAHAAVRTDLRDRMSSGGRGGGSRGGRARSYLVVGQVGLSTTLLVVAALLARSFQSLTAVDPGFDATGVITFSLGPSAVTYPTTEDHQRYHLETIEAVRATSGVARAALVSDLLFTGSNMYTTLGIEGRTDDPTDPPQAEYRVVTPNYFEVLDIPVLAGALPDESAEGDEIPVVINQHMAETYWGGEALGATARLGWTDPERLRVVAVVGNVLDDGYDATSEPIFYLPFSMAPRRRMAYAVQVRGDPGPMMATLASVVGDRDPDIPLGDPTLLTNLMRESVSGPRAASAIGAVLALIALLVSATGIYGVIAYSVQRRTRELGIRAALGAARGDLVSMVVRGSSRALGSGLALGIVGALLLGGRLAGLLFGVRAWDPVSLGLAVVLLGAIGTLAAWIPARRALRVAPVDALRSP